MKQENKRGGQKKHLTQFSFFYTLRKKQQIESNVSFFVCQFALLYK
jgi:hypothetical protein